MAAEREFREGDWECPDCGAHCFASRETCFKCDRAAAGGGAGGGGAGPGGRERQEGDWDCPDCGYVIFANKETCIRCEKRSQEGPRTGGGKGGEPRERQEGDWDCPDCGFLVFSNRETCIRCDKRAQEGETKGGGKKGGKKGGKAKGKGGAGPTGLPQAIKSLQHQCPAFKQAWVSYCDAYAEGWYDVGKHEPAFVSEFVSYVAGLVQTDVQGGGSATTEAPEPAEAPRAPAGQKRAAAQEPPSAPAEKKKVTVKKAVAAKIQALNASGVLLAPLRLGAVAGALCQLDEAVQLDSLAMLEEQAADIEDPNEFLKSQSQVMLTAAEEA